MATFPDDLKYTEARYGFAVNPLTNHVRFSSGNTRQRKIAQSRNDQFTVNMRLDSSDFVDFENYVRDTLNFGSLTFVAPYQVGLGEMEADAYMVEGSYTATRLALGLWDVTFTLELVDRSLLVEEGVYQIATQEGSLAAVFDFLDEIEDLINNNGL